MADLWRVVGTFHLVAFAWIFFRASSLDAAFEYIGGFSRLTSTAAGDGGSVVTQTIGVVAVVAAAFALDWVDRNRDTYQPLLWSPLPLGVAAASMIVGLIVFSGGTLVPFIYFQF